MKVTFGWHLDSRQGPLLRSRLNEPVVGRLGFLGLLELHLGLAGPSVTRARRVAAYLKHLRQADNQERFYSRSLQADEMGTASELLRWRDEWLLYGWDGSAAVGAPTRISDLTIVESTASKHLPPGEAERLRHVRGALELRKPPIDEVRLMDPWDRVPKAWKEVLAGLPVRDDSALVPMACRATSTLRLMQQAALQSAHAGVARVVEDLPDDGSIAVYRSQSVTVAHHWLVERSERADQLLVCEHEGAAVDDVFRSNGEPVCGFDRPSAYRPALQVAGLALELLWKPVDAHRVLEFLTHPYGPFSRRARRRLARAYAVQPGYAGQQWTAAKADIEQFERGSDLLAHVSFWFEGQRWTREEGAPLLAVHERIERVARSLRSLMASPRDDTPAIAGGIKQCDALLDAVAELKAQGIDNLSPRHVEQLLVQATSVGSSNPYAEPEVGCRRSTTTSALVALEPAQEVVWWMPSKPSLPAPRPWSVAEIEALRITGAELPNPAEELSALAKDWLRPLMAAQERFVLVLPHGSEEEHPIWLLIRRLFPKLTVRHIEQEVAESRRSEVVKDQPLPNLRRYLNVPSAIRSTRDKQSFTSLADFFDNPAIAVLKDAAALRGASVLAVEDERRLFGTLAHRLVEQLFGVPGVLTWSAAEVRAWFDANAAALIEAEGAPLLMLGFGVALHRFRATVREGTVALLAHLQSAGAVGVKIELPLEGTLFGVSVVGKVDLLVTLPTSKLAVIDLKWSGEGRYRERLATGTHLQLAIYASLIEQNLGQAPDELAFFIIDSRALLATSDRVFKQAQVCSPPPDGSVKELLSKAEGSWHWRNQQLDDGVLEVVDPRLADIDEFQGPDGTLPVKETGPWNAEYLALLGWQNGA